MNEDDGLPGRDGLGWLVLRCKRRDLCEPDQLSSERLETMDLLFDMGVLDISPTWRYFPDSPERPMSPGHEWGSAWLGIVTFP